MDEHELMAEQFEQNRARLRGVAYRMLGSLSDADDALQETWLRVDRADTDSIDNPGGWLTTVTARVCLNMIRSRQTRREEPLGWQIPDPVVTRDDAVGGEQQAVLADSVSLALLVVFQTLEPAQRLAFILHDMFAVPFDEIAPMVGKSPAAARQLASRARRTVQGAQARPDADLAAQRQVVDAFFAAARQGRLDDLVAVLDPDVVLRSDGGTEVPRSSVVVRGADGVAARAITFSQPGATLVPVLVNGAAGVVVIVDAKPFAVMGFTVRGGRVIAIDVLADRQRLRDLDTLANLDL